MHAYTVVDAFTTTPLEGNPVAVFFDADDLSADTMQSIAREVHLSECTFVLRAEAGGDARIRIFTPVNELPFAGHPLLGTAVALGTATKRDELSLETRMGAVPFTLERRDGEVVGARMRQPVPTWEPFDRAGELLDMAEIVQGVGLGRPSLMRAVVRREADEVSAIEVGGNGVTVAQGTIYM